MKRTSSDVLFLLKGEGMGFRVVLVENEVEMRLKLDNLVVRKQEKEIWIPLEDISIMTIPRRATYKPVHADADMEDLLDRAINQNYVPVIDDQGFFIGIITRKEIIKYCYKELKAAYADRQTDSPAQENN